jgi:tetratricopeptide (TPR) repeat protein
LIQFLSSDQRTWFLGFLLLIANTVLAYSYLSLGIKAVILVLGVLLPIVLLFISIPDEESGPARHDLSLSVGPRTTLAVIGLGLVLRFVHLTDFRPWPTGDESQNAFLAIDLIHHPHWQFFYTPGEQPPLLIWSLNLFFRFGVDPFFSLWFLPALLSSLALLVGWAVARTLFPGFLAFLLTSLLALSFWPLNFGRFCEQGTLIPFWELTALILFVWVLRAPDENWRYWRLFLLGLWTGLGTLTYTSWLVVGAGLTVATFALFFERNIRALGVFLLGSVITALPFLFSVFSPGYFHHLSDVSPAGHLYSASHQALTALSYITSLFWGTLQVGTSYGPRWGGMLNPVLSTGFFLGLGHLWARRREAFARWTAFGLLLSLLPGSLSADYVEHYRIIQAMPFVLLVAALGVQEVVLSFSLAKARVIAAVFLFLVSFGLDMNHLWKPVKDAGFADLGLSEEVRQDNVKAYRLLDSAQDQMGPGLIFTDFLLTSHNNSLSVMTYRFNAAMNPKLDPEKARWAGVIINVHYQSFLAARFPGSQWRWISEGGSETDGGLTVGLISLNDQNRPVFQTWLRAHDVFHRLNVEWSNSLNQKDQDQQVEANRANYGAQMAVDPFLESCFDEWNSQYHYGYSLNKNIEALQQAVRKGYPAAHLYFKLGYFLMEERRFPEARAAFEQALRQKPNYTNAAGYLQLIDQRFPEK